MSELSALNSSEIDKLKAWIDSNPEQIPTEFLDLIRRILAVYLSFCKSMVRAKGTLETLRKAMGLIPKSEKGSQAQSRDLTEDEKIKIKELSDKRTEAAEQRSTYSKEIKNILRDTKIPKQMEFDFSEGSEMLFSWPTGDSQKINNQSKVPRMREFGKEKGLHSTYDNTTRVDLSVMVTRIDYAVETVTDFSTGKSVRAPMIEVGPPQFQFTWKAIGNLLKMHVGFAIPINRIGLMIGQPEFSSSKICRVFEYLADELVEMYVTLAEELSEVSVLKGDDTKTKIIDLTPDTEVDSITTRLDKEFGWAAEKANGTGPKKALNVSLLSGKTEKDPRSTIRFFRTHQGSVGNVVSKLLEIRNPKNKKLTFQGDLSSTNYPIHLEPFELEIAGCGAHARRPFWRYRDEDSEFCYFMLRGFAKLSKLEKIIDLRGRNYKNIIKYRTRYGKKLWQALKNRCEAAIIGENKTRFAIKDGYPARLWPKGTDLYSAANYIIKNFDALTLYLENPYLSYTNNISERAIRIEKLMLQASKFRKNRKGRAILDILRTINATCAAAQIDVTEYLIYYFTHQKQAQENPKEFTPYQVALKLQAIKSK